MKVSRRVCRLRLLSYVGDRLRLGSGLRDDVNVVFIAGPHQLVEAASRGESDLDQLSRRV